MSIRRRSGRGIPFPVAALIIGALYVVAWLIVHVLLVVVFAVILTAAMLARRRRSRQRLEERQRCNRATPALRGRQRPATVPGSGPLSAGLARRKHAEDSRMRRAGWLPPIGEEDDDEPPY